MNFPTGEDTGQRLKNARTILQCDLCLYVYIFVALTILFQSIRLKWLRAYILTHVIVSESTTQDLLMLQL